MILNKKRTHKERTEKRTENKCTQKFKILKMFDKNHFLEVTFLEQCEFHTVGQSLAQCILFCLECPFSRFEKSHVRREFERSE